VGYDQVAVIFPVVVAAPRYFAGAMELGGMMQTVGAFGQVQSALSWFVSAYASLANWRAIVERLTTFHRAIVNARAAAGQGFERMDAADGIVRLHGVTISLPNGSKLLEDEDLELRPGHSVVVTGRSGTGKSTLFRAFAGIWPFGHGRVEIAEDAFFLPQRPYIPLGTLRHVLTYPHPTDTYTREQITQVLTEVGLHELVGEIDHDSNWPMRLSGGEQQRIAMARAILNKPTWVFLDEATASLDPEGESELYRALRQALPQCTIVSIAHGSSIAAFHEQRLVFQRDEGRTGKLTPGELIQAAAD